MMIIVITIKTIFLSYLFIYLYSFRSSISVCLLKIKGISSFFCFIQYNNDDDDEQNNLIFSLQYKLCKLVSIIIHHFLFPFVRLLSFFFVCAPWIFILVVVVVVVVLHSILSLSLTHSNFFFCYFSHFFIILYILFSLNLSIYLMCSRFYCLFFLLLLS